ncbi:MAG: serine/threonine-protein kinase [Anaerolineales bacterium]|nr:serine/threonine-protein kinase [Anaerolineales bacterium]
MTDLTGQSLGRYHILEQLGEGGMALVYKAYDTRLEREVAVKVIRTERLTIETMAHTLKRFEREAKALARLTHPNIVPVSDYGEFEGQPYLVMPYLPGGTLKARLGRPIPWQEAVRLILPVVRALEYAHSQGVIHRDVKPSNILMTASNAPLLTDFGIAKILSDTEATVDLTGTGVGIGTPEYMAPEQGLGGEIDARADVYSLGIVFYELVTGRRPFSADTPLAVIVKHINDPLPPPTTYVPGLPGKVEDVLRRALAKNAAERYQTMDEFARAMEGLQGQGVGSKEALPADGETDPGSVPETRGTVIQDDTQFTRLQDALPDAGESATSTDFEDEPSAPEQRVWWPWALAGGGLVLLGCVAVLGLGVWWLIPLPESVQVEAPVVNQDTPSAVTRSPVPTPTETAIRIPTPFGGGEWIAFHSDRNGNNDIYLVRPDGNSLTQATFAPEHDTIPAWSPDGSQIAYQSHMGDDWELVILTLGTGQIVPVTDNHCNDFAPVWSPDGTKLIYYSDCDGNREIYTINVNGSGRVQLTYTSDIYNWFPSWSPDGQRITFSSNLPGVYRVFVMNADGSNQQSLVNGCVSSFSPDGERILFSQYCSDSGNIHVMNTDGSNAVQLTFLDDCRNPAWSPDGTWIVFQRCSSAEECDLWIMSADGSNMQQVTSGPALDSAPAWQPADR